ncbi:phage tail protein [Herbaspirillum seropedicae]|uniref:phage tail protein n=1 Tax=Herbaspirillum seropedicae TaxID=964 RepID=UPI003D991080
MKIFHYSRATGELIEPDIAREDPLLPGQYRLPAFATIDTPPPFVSSGHVAAYLSDDGQVPQDYRDGSWREVADYRGIYWRTDSGQEEALERIGVTPQECGLTDQPPPAFGAWNGQTWEIDQAAAKAARNAAIASQIALIEQNEQPAAQRAFVLTGDRTAMKAIQEQIDALAAQMTEDV